MTNEHQIKWVEKQLIKRKRISRNECLRNYISRLGAIIHVLKERGYVFDSHWSMNGEVEFHGDFVKTPNGKDYVYTLLASPKSLNGKQKN
jgi:hypothetical protein